MSIQSYYRTKIKTHAKFNKGLFKRKVTRPLTGLVEAPKVEKHVLPEDRLLVHLHRMS